MTTQNLTQKTSLSPETTAGGVVTKPVVVPVDKAISWAKLYLALGWSLVPISPETKIPTVAWKKYQETPPTLEEVTSWLNKGWYLAVITGDVSKVCVIDDDRIKHGLPEYGFTSPLVATTQSGGKHYYFLYDREIHTHVNTKLHVDLKAWHSYVLVPPFKGRKWETDLVSNAKNLPPLPEDLVTLIRSDMENVTTHTPLEKQELLDVSEGSRSDSIYKLACSLFNDYDFDSGKRILIGVNDTYHPPLPTKQFDYDVQRAYDYVQAHPKDSLVTVSTELKSKIKTTPITPTPELPPEKKEELFEKYSKSHPILDTTTFRSTSYAKPKWLVNKLIRTGGISFLVGESGTGKTICALTIAQALSTGKPWLDKFETTISRVLILDKENEPSDIQKHFSTMGIYSDNIHTLFTSDNYNLMDEKVKKTEMAEYISEYIKRNQIDVVIMDSIIDFTIGDESDSGDVAKNINVWREIISPASILAIHHFKKADPRQQVKAADMMRGSSVWLSSAQSVLALTVPTFGKSTILAVESVKVRSGKKQPPFQMEMVIRPDPFTPGETIVDGFKYLHEINEVKLKIDDAKEAVIKLLSDNPETEYTATEIKALLAPNGITEKNIDTAIPQLVQEGEIYNSSGTGVKGSPKAYKMCVTNMLEKVEEEAKNDLLL